MRKVALYVRVSTIEQAEQGYSIDEQISKLEKFCDVKDWSVYKKYVDPGFSGSNMKRPGLEQLIADSSHSQFDTVLVYKLDRLSRSQKDTLFLIEDVFAKNKVEFVSLNENFDTSTSFGKAMVGILSVFAQLEREQIKERMKLGKLGRAKSGKSMNWNNIAFGYSYVNGELVVNDIEAHIVKDIYLRYLAGDSISKIQNSLNDAGHIAKKTRWSYGTIKQVLRRPIYIGKTSYNGKTFKGTHDPIIDEETFNRVQQQLKIRQQEAYSKYNISRPFQSKYMLSGLLQCGYCGSKFSLVQGSINKKTGNRIKNYKCVRHIKYEADRMASKTFCSTKVLISKESIEHSVCVQIEELRVNNKLVKNIHNKDSIKSARKSLSKQLKKIEAKLDRTIELYVDGNLPVSKLNKLKEQLLSEKESIQKELEKMDKQQPELPEKEALKILKSIKTNILKLDYDTKTVISRKLISKIIVTEGNVEIRWRFDY